MYLKLTNTKSIQKNFKKVVERHFNQTYGVDRLLAHRSDESGSLHYLVQWKECGLLQSTWEPEANLAYAQRAKDKYWARSRQRDLSEPRQLLSVTQASIDTKDRMTTINVPAAIVLYDD